VRFVKQSSDRWQRLHRAEDIIEVVSITIGGMPLKILHLALSSLLAPLPWARE
jgi:hypothetical protein